MEVRLASLLDGARTAQGTVVVVDVLRAYTTAAVALSRGAAKIVLVAEPEEALALRARGVGELCVGEVGGQRPPGFDYGNSPHELSTADVRGRTLIQSTRAGTVGAAAVGDVEALYGAALIVAGATAEIIRRDAPALVTVVAMGREARVRTDEDELCALFLRNRLEGRRPDPKSVRRLVCAGAEAVKFGDPARPHFHAEDLEWALRVDAFEFAIPIRREDGLLVARARPL